jgi:hypothetical protein
MGVVIETFIKCPGGPTQITVTDIYIHIYIYIYIIYIYIYVHIYIHMLARTRITFVVGGD